MLPQKQCTGCLACVAACNQKSIQVECDKNGFSYPKIMENLCVHCMKCERVCPVLNKKVEVDEIMPRAYAAYIKKENIRNQSSSGGIFTSIAEYVLEQKGVVFGAALDEELKLSHIAIEDKDDLINLRGSKYIQSDMRDCYAQVETELKAERLVLFSGTPCQIEGMLSFLEKRYPNLIAIDIICHGVPSAKVWKEYLEWQEKVYKNKILKANFRDKSLGWKKFSMKLEFENETVYRCSLKEDAYMKAFLANLSLRESCYQCAFKCKHHESDITLADLWGIQDIIPELDDDKGMSLVLTHSDKGKQLLENILQDIVVHVVDSEKAIEHNGAMIHSAYRHPFREYFFNKLGKTHFDKLIRNCLEPSLLIRVERKVYEKLMR